MISAQKADTANDFSMGKGSTPNASPAPNGLALSTANLFSAVQPGRSFYGLQHSNPVDAAIAYSNTSNSSGVQQASYSSGPASAALFGQANFYYGGVKVGGSGVSGDTSCTDQGVAWKVRHALKLDSFQGVGGVSGDSAHPDNIIFDIQQNPDGTGGTGQTPVGIGGGWPERQWFRPSEVPK